MDGLFYVNRAMHFDEKRGKWRGYLYYYDADGKRRYKTKTIQAKGKRAAKAEFELWAGAQEQAAQNDMKRNPSARALGDSTVADYVAQYIDMREATKAIEASTIKGYRTALRYIRERFSGTAIKELQSADAESWIAELTARGLSSSSVGKAYRLLKMVLNDALNHGVIDRNPLVTVKPPKRANKKTGKNALDAHERTDLLRKLDAIDLCPVTVAAYFALYTGLRRAEICALQWRDLDIANRVVWVKRSLGSGKGGAYLKQPKTDKQRDVALPATLVDVLARWKVAQRKTFADNMATFREDTYIIGDPLGFYQPDRLSREWHTLAKLFNIRGVEGRIETFHDLRHTWATMFLSSGGDVNTAASNLGHSKPSMTLDVYASADPDAKRRAAEIVEQAMRESER